jgi:hypothetical protein
VPLAVIVGSCHKSLIKLLGIPTKSVSDSELKSIHYSDARPVAIGPKRRWRADTGQQKRDAPGRPQHTARGIHQHIQAELAGAAVASSTVRRYVRNRKVELGLTALRADGGVC